MGFKVGKVKRTIGEKVLEVETGKLARQADAAVTVKYGGTVVLVTCVMSSQKKDFDFLPLLVEYREKTYAAGKIPGGFFKREGKPSDKEILTSRLIDRPVRALIPDGMRNDLQIMATVLSSDGEINPDILAVNGASFALTLSPVPFDGPIGCIRVGKIGDKFIINPTYSQLEKSSMDFVVAAEEKGIVMLEGDMKELPENEIIKAISYSFPNIKNIIAMQEDLKEDYGKKKEKEIHFYSISEELKEIVREKSLQKIRESYELSTKEKRTEKIDEICKELIEDLVSEDSDYEEKDVKGAVKEIEKEDVRRKIVEKKVRIDGRDFDQIREVNCEAGMLPRTHGSGLFTRGETQSLAVITLGTRTDEQMIDALEGESYKKFMLHYNFPPFSVGEVKPTRGPGRREIGHGVLAERALDSVMPSEEDFPYTIRVVSDILESNGSSSMATVCGASLSLMDAGVPISSAVSGIAMGLVKEGNEEAILTDIKGIEDHLGDMDFKIAGTKKGVTVIQLDVKIKGLTKDILQRALVQSRKARMEILHKMNKTISEPRTSLSTYAPRIKNVEIDPEKVGNIIGPGGKTIKKIIEKSGATIDIDDLEGVVTISGKSDEEIQEAETMISNLVKEVKEGEVYEGKITRIENFGAFCELLPGKEGLIHISNISEDYVENITDVINVGDMAEVKVIEIDDLNRINLRLEKVLHKEEIE